MSPLRDNVPSPVEAVSSQVSWADDGPVVVAIGGVCIPKSISKVKDPESPSCKALFE